MKIEMSLLDIMASQIGCMYLSNLKSLDGIQKFYLARWIEKVEALDTDLFDWNDALEYISGNNILCKTASEAKTLLIEALYK